MNGKRKKGKNVKSIITEFASKTLLDWKKEFIKLGEGNPKLGVVSQYSCKTKGFMDLNARLERSKHSIQANFRYEDLPMGCMRIKDSEVSTNVLDYDPCAPIGGDNELSIIMGREENHYSTSKFKEAVKELTDYVADSVIERRRMIKEYSQ